MSDSSRNEIERLQEAMEAYLAWCEDGDGDAAAFLQRHADLRDLLEPILAEAEPRGGDEESAQLGGFRLGRELGRGGMGVVYEAWHKSLGRRVALKVLADHLTFSPESIARFRREASLAGKLQHPGIVGVHDVGNEAGAHFIVMELVEGAPLDRILAKVHTKGTRKISSALAGTTIRDAIRAITTRRDAHTGDSVTPGGTTRDPSLHPAPGEHWNRSYVETTVDILAQVAEALAHAHSHGVIHRDVKPANILVREDGVALLADFGIAREHGLPSMTLTGEFAGTPYYVSPEQAKGKSDVDPRADIYSVGATLYEVLTGQPPFTGDSAHEVLHKIVHDVPVDAQKLNPHLAPDLAAIVGMALEKDPAARYADAAAFAKDLRAFLGYRPVMARRATRSTRLRRWMRREPIKATLAATLLLGTIVVAGMGIYIQAGAAEREEGQRQAVVRRAEAMKVDGFNALHAFDAIGAQKKFDAALQLIPNDLEASMGRIFASARTADYAESLAWMDHHRAEPEPAAFARMRAYFLERRGDAEASQAILKELAEPQEPIDLLAAGWILRDRQGRSQADLERSVNLFRRARIKATQPNQVTLMFLGEAAIDAGRLDLALDAADAFVTLWPGSAVGPKLQARVAGKRGDRAGAVALLRDALQAVPNAPDTENMIAGYLLDDGKVDEAIKVARGIVQKVPKYGPAWNTLAAALGRKRDFKGSLDAASKALAAGVVRGEVHQNLGNARLMLGDVDKALGHYGDAVTRQPDNEGVHSAILQIHRRRRAFVPLIAEHRRWAAVRSDDPTAWAALSRALIYEVGPKRDLPKALKAAEKALALSGATPEPGVLMAAADANFRNRKFAIALAFIRQMNAVVAGGKKIPRGLKTAASRLEQAIIRNMQPKK